LSAKALATTWLAITLILTGCAGAISSDGVLQPLVVGTEQYLTVDWQPDRRNDGAVVWGYVYNQSPYTFDSLRMLVDALGPDGQIVAQRVVWSPGRLGSLGRNYFEASMIPAFSYNVRVFSYDRADEGRRRDRFW
jgi:hypothetical protein